MVPSLLGHVGQGCVQSPDGVAVIPQVRHVLSLLGLVGVDRIADRAADDFDASALLCPGFEPALSCQLDRCSEVCGLRLLLIRIFSAGIQQHQ